MKSKINPNGKVKKEKKTIKKSKTENDDIKLIVSDALARILSLKTKRTFQEEISFISETIKDYIDVGYVSKEKHEVELLEQLFITINYLKQIKGNKEIDKIVKELEQIAGEQK